MKKVPVIAIYDNLIGYKNISIEQNESVAIRAFTNSVKHMLKNDGYTDISPADLSLYKVGMFNLDTGVLEPCEPVGLVYGTQIITEYMNESCTCDCEVSNDEV